MTKLGRAGDSAGQGAPGEAAALWHEANQRYLVAKLAVVAERLRPEPGSDDVAERQRPEAVTDAGLALAAAASAMPGPPALEVLASVFGLSPFERDVVLLCAGVELDASFAARCAAAQGDPRRPEPSFGLALAALPGAHWSALAPGSPLRHHHLIELGAGEGLTRASLRIDERVLHYLVGVEQPDERVADLLEPSGPVGTLSPSQRLAAEQVASLWARAPQGAHWLRAPWPVAVLVGGDADSRRGVAATACAELGLRLDMLDARALASRPDVAFAQRLLAREAALRGGALLIEIDDEGAAAGLSPWQRLAERCPGPVLLGAAARARPGRRPFVAFEVPAPDAAERRALWRGAIAEAGLDAAMAGATEGEERRGAEAWVDRLAAQFDLGAASIGTACRAVASSAPAGDVGAALWGACRHEARSALDDLAERIEPSVTWSDLVLPEATRRELGEIASSLRHRAEVQGAWGFGARGERGLGTGALFAGPSGTGKTMAAEVLAADARLDLYRVDLSRLVSKYIGETEKNLRRVFDAAERGAGILLFDEADALFGRRGEVREGADRYANLEVAYLLQRMEGYRGLAILTTNLERSLDPAFARRLRFVVRFPLPGAAERAALWRRAFPPKAPTEGLDVERLAELTLTGGSIRNVALRAAYLAAERGAPVRTAHVLEAARAEYDKLGRALAPGP